MSTTCRQANVDKYIRRLNQRPSSVSLAMQPASTSRTSPGHHSILERRNCNQPPSQASIVYTLCQINLPTDV